MAIWGAIYDIQEGGVAAAAARHGQHAVPDRHHESAVRAGLDVGLDGGVEADQGLRVGPGLLGHIDVFSGLQLGGNSVIS